ncbi:hypothetical protein [Chitinophaga tropicalis]|uniref:Lipoprotein n=1 Tax=Chitinophaga tropicalis TaxID=2683588 RepID=A0A7K1U020_9BACT|nr:hypothetical protein [Chitinophaga tropicalis]MVT07702.1 hypothetical protein [Chitinophaga tropicalis]
MKTLPILLSFAALSGCDIGSAGKGNDISGTYVANYHNEFSHVQDTIVLEAIAKTGTYIFRSHGLITGQLDGKPLAPQHPRTKPEEATFDINGGVLRVGSQGDIYQYHVDSQWITRGQSTYRRINN